MEPETIRVGGKRMTIADFQNSKNLKVGGDLSLSGCTGLTALPDGLTVGGSLYLDGCTGLTALPDGLTVGGYLYLDDSPMALEAASLTDPWASLVTCGAKTLETRKGAMLSGFAGLLVIHRTLAAAVPYDLFGAPLLPSPRPDGWPDDDRGHAIGIALVKRTYRLAVDGVTPELQRAACFEDIGGRYISEIIQASWLVRPVQARGFQGRWQIELPRDAVPQWVFEAIEEARVAASQARMEGL